LVQRFGLRSFELLDDSHVPITRGSVTRDRDSLSDAESRSRCSISQSNDSPLRAVFVHSSHRESPPSRRTDANEHNAEPLHHRPFDTKASLFAKSPGPERPLAGATRGAGDSRPRTRWSGRRVGAGRRSVHTDHVPFVPRRALAATCRRSKANGTA